MLVQRCTNTAERHCYLGLSGLHGTIMSMPTPHSIVEDPTLGRALSEALLAEIHAAVQPTGDCVACNQPLGSTRPLRLDMTDTGPVAAIYTRHAACTPVPEANGAIFLPPSTYRLAALRAALTTGPQGFGREVAHVLINPAIDVFTLVRDPETDRFPGLLEGYFRDGFRPIGEVPIGGSHPSSSTRWGRKGDHLWLDISGQGFTGQFDEGFFNLVTEQGGFLLTITFVQHIDDLVADPQSMRELVRTPRESATLWVPSAASDLQ